MIWVWINGKFEKIIKLRILFSSSSMGNSGLARVSVDCSPRSRFDKLCHLSFTFDTKNLFQPSSVELWDREYNLQEYSRSNCVIC